MCVYNWLNGADVMIILDYPSSEYIYIYISRNNRSISISRNNRNKNILLHLIIMVLDSVCMARLRNLFRLAPVTKSM